jgi:hypothetical protein
MQALAWPPGRLQVYDRVGWDVSWGTGSSQDGWHDLQVCQMYQSLSSGILQRLLAKYYIEAMSASSLAAPVALCNVVDRWKPGPLTSLEY